MRTYKTILCAATAIAAVVSLDAGSAHAQDSGAMATAPAQLEEVVVQARRTDESQQDVPIAVSAVTNERLVQAAVSSVADIQRLVPSLQVQQSVFGSTDFLIRGAFAGYSVDPSVLTYFDDVAIDSRALIYATFDLSSAQQLKGPQGTLFGKNSTGGAVLFFAQRPILNEFSGYGSLRYGNYDDRRFEGAVNVPLGDSLALRVAGEVQKRDGTIDSVTRPGLKFNDRQNHSIRTSLLWRPTDRFENYTQFTLYRAMENRAPRRAISLAGPCTAPTSPALSCLFSPPFNSLLGTDNLYGYVAQQFSLPDDKTTLDRKMYANSLRESVTNTFTFDMGPATLKNTSYLGYTHFLFANDWDGTPARVLESINNEKHQEFYTETQLFGLAFDDRLDWRIGAVYNQDEGSRQSRTTVFPFPVSLNTPTNIADRTWFKSYALFGQATFDMSSFVEGLSFTAGYRYTWDTRKLRTINYAGAPAPICQLQVLPVPATGPVAYPSTDLATCTRNLKLKSSAPNYNFTLSWKATDDLLLYASARRGYKAGSFNTYPPPEFAIELAQYEPEIIKDIELGVKADWRIGNMPVRTNAAIFDSKYTDIQITQTYIAPSGAASIVIQNRNPTTGASNKAKIKGFEIEATAIPVEWLELTAFYSKVSGKFKQYTPVTGGNLAGQNISGIIPSTFGVTGLIRVPLNGPFDGMTLNASYYTAGSPLQNSTSTDTIARTKAIDARLQLTNLFDSQVDVAFYGKNLGDDSVCNFNRVVSGENTVVCTEGRTYGIELRRKFGGPR